MIGAMIKILLVMVLLHVIDDFHLQGILAKMKQRYWWLEQSNYKQMYKNDYKVALLIHSLSWSIMITLPLWWYITPQMEMLLVCIIAVNTAIHYIVDDLKCNKLKINLQEDQTIHFIQIMATWFIALFLIL